MEDILDSQKLKIYQNGKQLKVKKSGLSDRLKTVNYKYYENIFTVLQKALAKKISEPEKQQVKRFDSTVITLSSKLLHEGFKVANGEKNQIKFTVGHDGVLPRSVRIGTTRSDMSEDVALKDAIKSAGLAKDDIVVFDRGLSSRKTFQEFSESGISFVTRLNDKANYRIVKERKLKASDIKTSNKGELEIVFDSMVQLRSKDVHWIKEEFRLIKAAHKETKKVFFFLTNIRKMSAWEITEIYRSRWDIEVFFKFIKQHLNAKHFLSRSLNGINVVFYMVLIASLLILTFKIQNKISSFQRAKKRFAAQINDTLTFEILLLYKDDPERFRKSFLSQAWGF